MTSKISRKSTLSICFAFTSIILLSSPTAYAQGYAVLDIDVAAKDLNVEANVKSTLEAMEKELEKELAVSQADIRSKMDNMLSVVGGNPNSEQRQRLVAQIRLLEAEFNQARAEAAGKIAAKQAEMIKDFADKIKPIAMEEAKKIRRDSVILKVNLFTYDDAIDITEETIKAATQAGLKMPVPPAPAPAPAVTK
jgi:Skp family chaperone for outer membrane proteins